MPEGGLLSSLSLFTLIGVFLLAGVALIYFMRKRSNRHPMDTPEGKRAEELRSREAEEKRREEGRSEL